MVFRCTSLIPVSPSFADVDCKDSYNGVCVSAAAPGLRNYGNNVVLGLDDRGIAVVSLPSGQWIRHWPSAYHQVVQVARLYELDMVVTLERELSQQLYLVVYRRDGTQLFTLPLATSMAVMGAYQVRSWIAVATSSAINVWSIEKGSGALEHVFEISLSKFLFGGLTPTQLTIRGNFIAFSTKMEIFVLYIVMCGEKANRRSGDNNRHFFRGRGGRNSIPFTLSDRRLGEAHGFETEPEITDEDDVLLCLFETAEEGVEAGSAHMPTFNDDAAELTLNEMDSAVRNADHLMSLQPINLRINPKYHHSYSSPYKCQIILARHCNPGTNITGIEMLELGQSVAVAAGGGLEHDGRASCCCLSLVVSTSQGAALYHLHSPKCDRYSMMSSDDHRASQAEMKCSTRFTCKSIISKSSRHFLFALTEDGLEIWTLSLACDCQGDIPVPALLHVQDLTAAGCTPCPPIWLMLILDIGLILIPGLQHSFHERRLSASDASDDHSPGRNNATAAMVAPMTTDVIDNEWLTGRCCLKRPSAMSVDAPVAALLELLPVVDIYAQIQEAVRQWLGNKAHIKLEPERGERYRACVMPFYYILRDESRRGLGSWGTTDDETVLMQSFSSSHDVLSTDCASLVAELCLASWGLDNSDGMLERLWEACKWFQRASMPTVVAMSCLTKWIGSVVASLDQGDNNKSQEWVTRCGQTLERALFEQYFIVVLLQSDGDSRPPLFVDESDEAMEEFDRLMFRAIVYMASCKAVEIDLLVHFVVSARNIPWKQLPRSRLEAYNCLSALSSVSGQNEWVPPERQAALAVLEMYLDDSSSPDTICNTKNISHAHAGSLVESCIAHPDLVLVRRSNNTVTAGPLAVALLADNQWNVLTRALVGLCRPPQKQHRHPSELAGGVSGRIFDPIQLLCALGPAGVAAANRITNQSRKLPTSVSPHVVGFLCILCNMGWNADIGLKAELMRSYLVQIESPSGPPPPCDDFRDPPLEWMWHLCALLTDIGQTNDSSSSAACDEGGGVQWTSGFMNVVFRMAGPSPSAIPPSELFPELHSVQHGEKWSAMDATIFVLQLSSEPVKKSVPRLINVLRSCRLENGRLILSRFIDYACGDEPERWRTTLAILRTEAQAEEDSEQSQLLANVAMDVMTSCSQHFRGSLKDFISAIPDTAPLAVCVRTLQNIGLRN